MLQLIRPSAPGARDTRKYVVYVLLKSCRSAERAFVMYTPCIQPRTMYCNNLRYNELELALVHTAVFSHQTARVDETYADYSRLKRPKLLGGADKLMAVHVAELVLMAE